MAGDKIVTINGWKFRDVTDETCSSEIIHNYEEALALTQGRHINTSGEKDKDEYC